MPPTPYERARQTQSMTGTREELLVGSVPRTWRARASGAALNPDTEVQPGQMLGPQAAHWLTQRSGEVGRHPQVNFLKVMSGSQLDG